MSRDHDEWTRVDVALWFIRHDEVDEAAWALQPGDELELGESDYRNLAAALGRRGLTASYELHRVTVQPPADSAVGSGRSLTEDIAAGARKPPARSTASPAAPASKKTA